MSHWKNGRTEMRNCAICDIEIEVRSSNEKYCEKCRKGYQKLVNCEICGGDEMLIAHHIISPKFGGDNLDSNQVTLCFNCHKAVHSIRSHQGLNITDKALKLFGDLVKECKTRMPPGRYGNRYYL